MRTFNLLVLAILGLFVAACDDDDHLGDWAKATNSMALPVSLLFVLNMEKVIIK